MDQEEHFPNPFWRSPAGVALFVALLGVSFYLLTEHTAHVFGVLPFLVILACPLMHLFMHRGQHGGHSHGQKRSSEDEQPRQ